MSALSIHGKLIYLEEPKSENASMLMVVAVGPEKEETGAMIQAVNKIIVRVPPRSRLQKSVLTLDVNDYVQIIGHVKGTVLKDIGTGSQNLSVEIVAIHVEKCDVSPLVSPQKVDSLLHSRWLTTGRIRSMIPPKKEGRPGMLYLQVAPDRKNANRSFQHSGVVPITVHGKTWDRIKELPAQHPIQATARLTGLLRKVPRVGEPGEFDTSLQGGLILNHFQVASLVPRSLTEARSPGPPTGKDAEAAKEESTEKGGSHASSS